MTDAFHAEFSADASHHVVGRVVSRLVHKEDAVEFFGGSEHYEESFWASASAIWREMAATRRS